MPDTNFSTAVPSLMEASTALAQLATEDALKYLEAALRSMEGLSNSLSAGNFLAATDKRQLKRSLLRFRAELCDASVLVDRGLDYCQNRAEQLQAPPGYQSNGASADTARDRHELSLEA